MLRLTTVGLGLSVLVTPPLTGGQFGTHDEGDRDMSRWQDENGIPVDDRGRYDAADIDWRVLDALPSVYSGWTAELKIERQAGTVRQRVWLERTTTADGEHCDHHVTVESYDNGSWVTTSEN